MERLSGPKSVGINPIRVFLLAKPCCRPSLQGAAMSIATVRVGTKTTGPGKFNATTPLRLEKEHHLTRAGRQKCIFVADGSNTQRGMTRYDLHMRSWRVFVERLGRIGGIGDLGHEAGLVPTCVSDLTRAAPQAMFLARGGRAVNWRRCARVGG
jgi:hypothetical protein